MTDECMLASEWKSCCCNCRYHIKDFSHPCTDGESIMRQRGWICAAPEMEGMFSGWSEHGMCEMHAPRKAP